MSELERSFQYFWRVLDGPELEQEYRFHPERKWRFDFAAPAVQVAIECEGGIHSGGRHVRGKGFNDDATKYNTATAMGWRLFRVTGDMLNEDPHGCLVPIITMIEEST